MKKIYSIIAAILFLLSGGCAYAATTLLPVPQGGTGATSFSLYPLVGNGTSSLTASSTIWLAGINATSTTASSTFQGVSTVGLSSTKGLVITGGAASFSHDVYFASSTTLSGLSGALVPYAAGRLFYDTDNESLTFYNNESQVSLQIGQESWMRVRNTTGATIGNGHPVYINGNSANLPTVAPAIASAEATSQVVGVTTMDIPNNSIGYVTVAGVVNGTSTVAYTAGDVLYLSDTISGHLTTTAPASPSYRVRVAVVTRSSATGALLVRLAGVGQTPTVIANGGTNATSFSARSLIGFDGTRLIATSSPTVGTLTATGTATSTFAGGISSVGLATSQGIVVTGGNLLITSGATSTFNNGINLTAGCFAINNSCISGTVTSITAGSGLSGGTITSSGTISLDLTSTNIWSGLQSYTNSATSTWTGGLFSQLGFSGLYGSFQTLGLGSNTATTTLSGNGSGIGIGSTTPSARLGISGLAGTNSLLVATSTGTAFIIDSQGRLGVGTTSPNVALDVVGAIVSREYAANGGATITIDWSQSTQQRVTLSQAGHTINFRNVAAGGGYRLILCQDGTGGRTVTTWDSINIWSAGTAPTLTSTANKCDILAFTGTFATSTNVRTFGQSAGSNF